MAFTKKTKPTPKPAPKPASYARKSKKQDPVEEPEVQDTESDYEDAPEPDTEEQEQEDYQEQDEQEARQEQERPRPSRGYSSNNYARPTHQRSQQAPRRSQGSQDGKGVRVTGLFAGKREGLWTGRLRKEDIENLMGLFDSALNSNQLVTMFLWENQDGPQFSLTANVAQEFKGGGGGGFRRGGFQRGGFRR